MLEPKTDGFRIAVADHRSSCGGTLLDKADL